MSQQVVDWKLLTPSDCRRVRTRVLNLREHWLSCLERYPHYALGAWSHAHAIADARRYYALARKMNPILRENFEWLYDLLARKIARALGEPAGYDEELALPGFKVFLAGSGNPKRLGHPHVDYPLFRQLGIKSPRRPAAEVLTFIMPVAMPAAGAGLDVWDVDFDSFRRFSDARKAFELSSSPRYHPYRLGYLTVQRGYVFHRASGTNRFSKGGDRITLQGHGIRRRGRWVLYL